MNLGSSMGEAELPEARSPLKRELSGFKKSLCTSEYFTLQKSWALIEEIGMDYLFIVCNISYNKLFQCLEVKSGQEA